jgi:hypothetical protein
MFLILRLFSSPAIGPRIAQPPEPVLPEPPPRSHLVNQESIFPSPLIRHDCAIAAEGILTLIDMVSKQLTIFYRAALKRE